MKAIVTVLFGMLITAGTVSVADGAVLIKQADERLEVTIDGAPFATYHYGANWPKPFFSPVQAADGTVLTRAIENPKDHPHHKGIWVSVDQVNGVEFWAEKGKIANHSVNVVKAEGDPAIMEVTNHWLGADSVPIVREVTRISIHVNRLVAYDIRFDALDQQVTFGDTKEGLFGFRMVDELRETEGAKVVNADGKTGTAECWGQTSAWVDYSGTVHGKPFGVAIFDHPLNFRPSRYHVRNYGLFSISPFGEKAYSKGKRPADPVILLPDTSLRLRYALYVHTGDVASGQVAEAYVDYLRKSGESHSSDASE